MPSEKFKLDEPVRLDSMFLFAFNENNFTENFAREEMVSLFSFSVVNPMIQNCQI